MFVFSLEAFACHDEARHERSKASALSINQEVGFVVAHGLSQSKWVSRFLDKLTVLKPDLDSAEVLALVTAAYKGARDLDPELAADVFARDLPTGERGSG